MKKNLKKLFALLLAVGMVAGMLGTVSFAEGEADPANVDPYIYYYNEYAWHISPHRVGDDAFNQAYQRTKIYRMDTQSGGVDASTVGYPAYCSDVTTSIQTGVAYKRVNLEDSTYYSDNVAAKIRGVLSYGYWVGRDVSELQKAANQWLKDNNITVPGAVDPETGEPVLAKIKNLTAAEALSATQAAVWNYSHTDVNGGKPLKMDYDDTTSAAQIREWYQYEIYDTETVDYDEPYRDTTPDNINWLIQYLMDQEAEEPEKIVFSGDHFISSKAVFTGKGATDTTYDVTLRFKLDGDFDAEDELTLNAKLAQRPAKVKNLTDGSFRPEDDGYYALTFEEVTVDEAEAGIELSVSGQQKVDGVYFYQPKPKSSTSVQKTTQNMVGLYQGMTPVSASKNVSFDLDTTGVELIKYVGDAAPSDEATDTHTVKADDGKYYPALEGAKFDLYAKIGEDYVLVESGLTSGADGKIAVTDLAKGYDYYFQETEAPDGYICDDKYHQIQWPDGTVTVENCFDVADLKLSKTVEGVPTDEHFSFTVELDLSTADLANAESLIVPVFEADWTGTRNCTVPVEPEEPAEGEEGAEPETVSLHNDTIAFTQDGEILTATVALKDGESLTIKGIPTGTSYTVTEAPNSYAPAGGATQDGVVGARAEEAAFHNVKYNSTDADIQAVKTVDDQAPGEQSFTFELYKWDSEDKEWLYADTVTNDTDGSVLFQEHYTRPGGDLFRIREVNEGGEYVYDNSTYYAQVKVTSRQGDLSASVKYYTDFENGKVKGSASEQAPVFNNKAYQDGTLYLSGLKYLDEELSERAFAFDLYDVTGERTKLSTAQSGAGGVFQFDEITFTQPGTYKYEVSERSTPGFDCDATVYTVTVEVTRDLATGEMLVGEPAYTVPNPEPAPDPLPEGTVYQETVPANGLVFYNTTRWSGPDEAEWQLKATKTLDGQPAGNFTFKMVSQSGKEYIATSAANGTITFPKRTFDEKGVYTYTITEVAGSDEGIVYDTAEYTVAVTVKKVAGDFQVTNVAITKDGEAAEAVAFANTTVSTEIPDEETPTGETGGGSGDTEIFEEEIPLAAAPATGDISAVWLALSALSGTGLVLCRKKRED